MINARLQDDNRNRNKLTLRIPYWAIVPFLLALLFFAGCSIDQFQISGDTISDSDTLMRLSYLREVMQTGHWQQHGFFDRNNAPFGMVLHWTLPFNLFILGFSKLLFFMTPDLALHYAGYWIGPVLCLGIAFAAYWACRPIASPRASALAAGLIVFSPFLFNYGDRGEANHHALLYLDTVVMAGFAFAAARRPLDSRIAILTGLMAGFCLWCSFELVILAASVFALLFYLWMVEGEPRYKQLLLSAASFAAITGFALLIDPPYGGYSMVVFDHVSLPLVGLSSLPLLVLLTTFPFNWNTWQRRLIAGGSVCAIVAGGWLLCFPTALGGIEGAMDPYVKTEWLDTINEVMPVHGWRQIAIYLGTGFLCLPVILCLGKKFYQKALLLIFFLSLGVMAFSHYRFAGYLIIAAAFLLAVAFDDLSASPWRRVRQTVTVGAIFMFFGFYTLMIISAVFDVDIEKAQENSNDESFSCDPYDVRDILNDAQAMGGAAPIVADDINMTPKLLYWTSARTLAGNYHRDNRGIKDSYLFFRDLDDKTAKDIARSRSIDYVLVCGDAGNLGYSFISEARAEIENKKSSDDYKPDPTLYTRLTDQKPPDWLTLKPWPDDVDSDLLLYKVDKTKLDQSKNRGK